MLRQLQSLFLCFPRDPSPLPGAKREQCFWPPQMASWSSGEKHVQAKKSSQFPSYKSSDYKSHFINLEMQKIHVLYPRNPVNSDVKPPCTWAVGISASVRAQSFFFTRHLGPWGSCDIQDVGEGPSASRAAWLPDTASTLNKPTMVPQSPRAPPASHTWGAGPMMELGKLVVTVASSAQTFRTRVPHPMIPLYLETIPKVETVYV